MPASHLANPLDPPGRWYPQPKGQTAVQLLPKPAAQPRYRAGLWGSLLARKAVLGFALALLAATVAAYYPVHRLPFLSINDGDYLTGNPHIQQLDWQTLRWAFTTYHAANWHPLTWLSHAVDFQLFSLDSGGHHLSNLLLHALNVVLLFWILWRATASIGRSFMVAALFALHPINVESVAWVAERKNLLSMVFLLLALGAYRWYASQPRLGRYSLVAICFVLGLISKPQVVTLPFIFLLWDYWPLGRMFAAENQPSSAAPQAIIPARSFTWLVLEKLPLLALSIASAIITLQAQRAGGAMGGVVRAYPLANRVENAIIAYARYLRHAIWPKDLAFFYPHARNFHLVWPEALLLLAITVLAVMDRKRRYLAVGWFWFLGAMVPMIGLVQVGGQGMADRYAYLPFVGLFIAFCWGMADWAEQWRIPQVWVAAASVAALALLMFATHRQLSYWTDDISLWSHTVQVTRSNSGAENMLGEALQSGGDLQAAMLHFRAAAAIDPLLPFPHYHIGIYEQKRGHLQAAVEQFKAVIDFTQNDTGILAGLRANTLLRMSSAYDALGNSAAAEKCAAMAVEEQRRDRSFEANTSQ